jgi:GTP-binding protein HflX
MADFLVHVVDASVDDPEGQIAAVHEVLAEIGADSVPELIVFNKADLAADAVGDLVADHEGSLAVSAVTGEGIDEFLSTLADRLRAISAPTELLIPYERGDVLASVHREGEVVSTSHEEDGIRVRARLDDASAGRLAEYVVRGRAEEAAKKREP